MAKLPKIFVLDTNVILHDHKAIYNFQENDLVVPVAVLEELDKFKKGNDIINYNAREFVRAIDDITDPRLYNGVGFPLGKGRGSLQISLNRPFPQEFVNVFKDDIQDHRILATAIWYKNNYPDRVVALVTKDVNLRLKAKALGMIAQDYLTDHIKEERISDTFKRVLTVKGLDSILLEKLASDPAGVTLDELRYTHPPCNQLYRFKLPSDWSGSRMNLKVSNAPGATDSSSNFGAGYLSGVSSPSGDANYNNILARYRNSSHSIARIRTGPAYGISARNDEQAFALDVIMDPAVNLIALTGTAGTGKTLLALAGALAQTDLYDQILLARPVIPLQNQEIGFIPGSPEDKIAPFMLPLYDNLAVIKKNFKESSKENVQIEDMLRREKLLISPLAYIRGRSLSRTFFIIDEAQNLTPHEVKTIITRAGEGTKIVFTGDIFQIDQPYLDRWSNGLTHLCDTFYGEELFSYLNLLKGERF